MIGLGEVEGLTFETKPISKARMEQARRRKFMLISGTSFFAGATQFLLVNTIAESLYKGYSISNQPLSDLGVGPVAPLWNSSLFLVGLCVILGGYFAYRIFNSRLTMALAISLGIGSIGTSLFPIDSPTGLHGVFALIAFAGGGLFTLATFKVVIGKLMKVIAISLGTFSLLALALNASATSLGLGEGMERMIVLPIVIWMVVFGGQLVSFPYLNSRQNAT